MADTHAALATRIERLEKHNRRLIALVAGLIFFGLLGAAARPDVEAARAFRLIDASGNVRAELAERDGAVGLFVFDTQGGERLRAIHDEDSTGLYIADDAGTTRLGAVQFAHGGGGFALHGADSKGAAVLYLKERGSLRFLDEAGNVTNQVLGTPSDND